MASKTQKNLIWLQSGGCGGCTLSLLGANNPDVYSRFEAANINLLWHPSLSELSGKPVIDLFNQILDDKLELDFLCLEGAVMRGPNGTGRFHMMSRTDEPYMNWIAKLAAKAKYVVAVGSCAAFGGITAAGDNHVEACGLSYDGVEKGGLLGGDFSSTDGLGVVNIAGCPVHPEWVTETLHQMSAGTLESDDLDEWQRPLAYTKYLVHHGCSRNEFYEYKASAETLGNQGCMMENLGCMGTQARADCNIRPWNGVGSCIEGGYPCINCTAPGFEEAGHAYTKTPKISGIPIGLPTDMPKAWFVALASLSKAATPERLKENARRDHLDFVPGNKKGRSK